MFALFPCRFIFLEGRLHSSWPLTSKYLSVFLRTGEYSQVRSLLNFVGWLCGVLRAWFSSTELHLGFCCHSTFASFTVKCSSSILLYLLPSLHVWGMQFSFKFLCFVCIHSFIRLSVCRCVCMCVCVGVRACQSTYVEARGQFVEVGSLFPTCGSQKLNSGQVTFMISPLRIRSFSCVCFCFLVFHWASALLPRKRHGWQCAFSEDHIWRPPTVCSPLTWWVCFLYPKSCLIPLLCNHWTFFPSFQFKKKIHGWYFKPVH